MDDSRHVTLRSFESGPQTKVALVALRRRSEPGTPFGEEAWVRATLYRLAWSRLWGREAGHRDGVLAWEPRTSSDAAERDWTISYLVQSFWMAGHAGP